MGFVVESGNDSMNRKESFLAPKVEDTARLLLSDVWGAEDLFLDQLAEVILTKYDYGQPISLLKKITESPITVTKRSDGSAFVEISGFLRYDDRNYGDCATLCYKVIEDSGFQAWLAELESASGSRVQTYLTTGHSPNFFIYEITSHFFLLLNHERTNTTILIDPSFRTVTLGKNYSYERFDMRPVSANFRAPREAVTKMTTSRYEKIGGWQMFDRDMFGFLVLGMGENGKIVDIGFGVGKSDSEPTIPLAKLIDLSGMPDIYCNEPNMGICHALSKELPSERDLRILKPFFETAKDFEFIDGKI